MYRIINIIKERDAHSLARGEENYNLPPLIFGKLSLGWKVSTARHLTHLLLKVSIKRGGYVPNNQSFHPSDNFSNLGGGKVIIPREDVITCRSGQWPPNGLCLPFFFFAFFEFELSHQRLFCLIKIIFIQRLPFMTFPPVVLTGTCNSRHKIWYLASLLKTRATLISARLTKGNHFKTNKTKPRKGGDYFGIIEFEGNILYFGKHFFFSFHHHHHGPLCNM